MNALKKIFDIKDQRLYGWIPFVAASGAVILGAVLPPKHIPAILTTVNDKLLHLLEFFVLWIASNHAFRNSKMSSLGKQSVLNALKFCIFMGALTECLQFYVPGRAPEWGDWIADIAGALIASIVVKTRWPSAGKG